MELPEDVSEVLARALGAYIGAVPRHELPNSLRPLQAFRPKRLGAHRAALLAALDDDNFRNDVLTWLVDTKPDLPSADAEVLRIACERDEGWGEELSARSRPLDAEDNPGPRSAECFEAMVEGEREKAKRARADAKRARTRAAGEIETLARRIGDLERDLERTRAELARVRDELDRSERRRAEAEAARDKEVRRAARAADAATEARDAATRALKAARKEAAAARRDADKAARRIASLEAEVARARARPARDDPEVVLEARDRRPLDVPKGRFDDDPQTLEQWLTVADVLLLVDGYNVTKEEGGFGLLELEAQRDRLVSNLVQLAQRTGVSTTVVYDGAVVAPAARRAFRGLVKVEYSVPGESADDHLVGLVERLPPTPVVVATSDRGLQERLRPLGATIATSKQLLALIR